jgi:hypothetical protein
VKDRELEPPPPTTTTLKTSINIMPIKTAAAALAYDDVTLDIFDETNV